MECKVYSREEYGGLGRRIFADFLDGVFLAIACAIVNAVTGDLTAIFVLDTVIFLVYMIGLKVYKGATLGYRILGMRIVAINGAEVTVKQVVVRILSSIFSSLAFGLGFIWIAIDTNKQAWHDKAAGTYVIRSGASPVRTMEIPQPGLIRSRLSATLILAGLAVFVGFFGGIMHFMKSSDAYRLSQQYIKANPWIQQEVGGRMKFGLFPTGEVSVSGASGEADFAIRVSGEKGKIIVYTSLEKREGKWVVVEGAYKDKEGNLIDITSPYSASWNELNEKARTLYQQGRYSEAAEVALELLRVAEKTFGSNHAKVAESLNNLASVYQADAKYTEAEPLYKRALALWEEVTGPDHPSVATTLNYLAGLYRVQGRYAEAVPLYERALAIDEKALGKDHPGVTRDLNDLGELYRIQGKNSEAESLHKRSLEIREKALGPDHPAVAVSLNNLALVYHAQAKYAEAEATFKRSLKIAEKALGPDHPIVAGVCVNMAELCKKVGKEDEAEKLEERVRKIRSKE